MEIGTDRSEDEVDLFGENEPCSFVDYLIENGWSYEDATTVEILIVGEGYG